MLRTILETLQQAGLIAPADMTPELEYLFRHALIQDAAYGSLLKADRRALHQLVGEALEQSYPERLEELAPVLAHHFEEAGDDGRALKYHVVAGNVALRLYANAEAVLHYGTALGLAWIGPHDGPLLTRVGLARGRALELSNRYAEAVENYRQLEGIARERDDQAMELAVLMARATVHSTPNPERNPAEALALFGQALSLAQALSDAPATAKILWTMMMHYIFSSPNLERALLYGDEALAMARTLGLREQEGLILQDISFVYLATGEVLRARQILHEASAIWRELGSIPMLADCLIRTAHLAFFAGEYERVLKLSEESLRLVESIGNTWGMAGAHFIAGHVYLERGEVERALEIMGRGLELGRSSGNTSVEAGMLSEIGWIYATFGDAERGVALLEPNRGRVQEAFPVFFPWLLARLISAELRAGRVDRALALMDELRSMKVDAGLFYIPAAVALARGELAERQGDDQALLVTLDEVLAQLHAYSIRPFLADVLVIKGRALRRLGRLEEAEEALVQARVEAEALGSQRSLWPALAALAELAEGLGDAQKAAELRASASAIVAQIAEHVPAELRASFLALPEVVALGVESS